MSRVNWKAKRLKISRLNLQIKKISSDQQQTLLISCGMKLVHRFVLNNFDNFHRLSTNMNLDSSVYLW